MVRSWRFGNSTHIWVKRRCVSIRIYGRRPCHDGPPLGVYRRRVRTAPSSNPTSGRSLRNGTEGVGGHLPGGESGQRGSLAVLYFRTNRHYQESENLSAVVHKSDDFKAPYPLDFLDLFLDCLFIKLEHAG